MATLIDEALRLLDELLDFKPSIKVLLLTIEHWKDHASFPVYGMPHYTNPFTLVVAAEDNGFWQSLCPLLTSLSPALKQSIVDTYGDAEGKIDFSLFFDWISIHELGHLSFVFFHKEERISKVHLHYS